MSDELERKSNHLHCLNALAEMQESNYYAVRRDVLKEAECLIWNYEKEVVALRAQLAACQEQVKELTLRSEVREWLCVRCNTVYPGPPAKGFSLDESQVTNE